MQPDENLYGIALTNKTKQAQPQSARFRRRPILILVSNITWCRQWGRDITTRPSNVPSDRAFRLGLLGRCEVRNHRLRLLVGRLLLSNTPGPKCRISLNHNSDLFRCNNSTASAIYSTNTETTSIAQSYPSRPYTSRVGRSTSSYINKKATGIPHMYRQVARLYTCSTAECYHTSTGTPPPTKHL
jgi:hypothetical protein